MTINKAEGPNDTCGKLKKGPGKHFQLRIHKRRKSTGSHIDKRHTDLIQSSEQYKVKEQSNITFYLLDWQMLES